MNALVITFVVVGIFLVLVGVAMLFVRIQTDTVGARPIFQGPGRIMVQGPVGLVIIVIGVVCLSFSGISYRMNGNNGSQSRVPNHTSSKRLGLTAALTGPTDGTQVSRSQGFTASGVEASLGAYTIWILDYDGGYTVDQEAAVAGGRWSAIDQPLGDSSNRLPYSLTMVAALANPSCAATLAKLNEGNNDYSAQLPAGCRLFGQVIVDVTRP
jgi:hypothetical protein